MSHWWTEEETALLINLWREDAIFSQVAATTTRRKKVYDNISEKLKSARVEKIPMQVKSTLKKLEGRVQKRKKTIIREM